MSAYLSEPVACTCLCVLVAVDCLARLFALMCLFIVIEFRFHLEVPLQCFLLVCCELFHRLADHVEIPNLDIFRFAGVRGYDVVNSMCVCLC